MCNSVILESSEVLNLKSNSLNDSSLLISWNPPAVPNGIILGYTILIINLVDKRTLLKVNTTADATAIFESGLSKYIRMF